MRRLARGERVSGVDWENVAQEIESVGRSVVRTVASLLRIALVHGLKLAHWPGHPGIEVLMGAEFDALALEALFTAV